jgi:hypothetical protein
MTGNTRHLQCADVRLVNLERIWNWVGIVQNFGLFGNKKLAIHRNEASQGSIKPENLSKIYQT